MPTLAQSLETFLKVDRSPITNRNYSSLLRRMAEAVGPARKIERIAFTDLLDFADVLKTELAPTSFRQYLVVIKTFFNWCIDRRYLQVSPADGLTARVPRRDTAASRAIPTDLLNAMIERSRYDPRDHALLLFLADTGGRRGAVASLRLGGLRLAEGRAEVVEKGSKRCWVYYGPATAQALDRWLMVRPAVKHDFVFTGTGQHDPLQPDSVSAIIRRLSRQCGGRAYGPHAIRHWVAESWVDAGATPNDVQHKLNHERVETTMRNYFPQYSRNV